MKKVKTNQTEKMKLFSEVLQISLKVGELGHHKKNLKQINTSCL